MTNNKHCNILRKKFLTIVFFAFLFEIKGKKTYQSSDGMFTLNNSISSNRKSSYDEYFIQLKNVRNIWCENNFLLQTTIAAYD
jgi:hypothetical protein